MCCAGASPTEDCVLQRRRPVNTLSVASTVGNRGQCRTLFRACQGKNFFVGSYLPGYDMVYHAGYAPIRCARLRNSSSRLLARQLLGLTKRSAIERQQSRELIANLSRRSAHGHIVITMRP